VNRACRVFSPVFADQVSYADLREAAASPGYKSLIHRADERLEAQ
jgi:hypothetical protein